MADSGRVSECSPCVVRTGHRLYDLDGVLSPDLVQFVDLNVRSLLTWDILVFFHKNQDAVIDVAGLAVRLGRKPEEVEPEIAPLCEGGILDCSGGLVRYRPSQAMSESVAGFTEACQDKGRRLALIARVLRNIMSQPPGPI